MKTINYFFLIFVLIFSQPALAEIDGLYDKQSEQVVGLTPLMSAVVSEDVSGVKFFSKAGRAIVNQKNLGGATALNIAARQGSFEIVQILIENNADVNIADNEGWTALMRAALTADKKIVALLLEKGAKADQLNSIGESALIYAVTSDCNDCLNLLLEKFDFSKLADSKILKEQITNAFVIAANHDNEIAQVVLEGYLDRAVKIIAQLEKEAEEKRQAEILAAQKEAENKVFVVSSEKSDQKNPEKKPAKTVVKKFKFNPGKKPGKLESKEVTTIEEKEIPEIVTEISEKKETTPAEVKKSEEIVVYEKDEKKENKKSWNLFSFFKSKEAKVSDEPETIYLIDKPATTEVEATKPAAVVPTPIFKFQKGAEGKPIAKKKLIEPSSENKKTFKLTKPAENSGLKN